MLSSNYWHYGGKMKKTLLFIVLMFGIFFSGCVSNTVKEQVQPTATVSPQASQPLEIVLKDVGLPEVKYLQPTIMEIQLKDQSGKWITIWNSTEGKTVKLTTDGAEVVLDRVNVKTGTYTETRMLVPTIDVVADINRDGDALDKNVQIILTEEEFASLPQQEKPQKPEEPQQPPAPQEPQLPPGVIKIEGGLVYMNEYLDEVHTATPPYFDGIHNDTYLYPALKADFVYDGSGGKIIYDFTLHPLKPKHEQISIEVSTTTPPAPTIVLPANITENVTPNITTNIAANVTTNLMTNVIADVKISSFTCSLNTVPTSYGSSPVYVRAVVKGTAQGQVGARLELPILIWSDDKFDCGNWTLSKGALIAVGSTCARKAGQPETTTWTVDTGGEEQGGWLKGTSRFYSTKIYMNNNIYPEKADNRTTLCQ